MANSYNAVGLLDSDSIVIFDLDGCISDDEWRLSMIDKKHISPWSQYHSNLMHDVPLIAGSKALLDCIDKCHGIIFMTARPESAREETRSWLRKHFPSLGLYLLFMRQEGDHGVPSPLLKRHMVKDVEFEMKHGQQIICAHDDRLDVLIEYASMGIPCILLNKYASVYFASLEDIQAHAKSEAKTTKDIKTKKPDAGDILVTAGQTFKERNAVYKDNYKKVGEVMAVLFPEGVHLSTAEDHNIYHLFELMIVKLTRFTNSGMRHQDSVHDMAVYAAMVESLVDQHNIKFTKD